MYFLNRGDLNEKANQIISNSVILNLVASLCFSLLNAFTVLKINFKKSFLDRTNDITLEMISK